MNNRQGDDFVMENLDRAFANVSWFEAHPHSIVRNLPILCADHGPIILDTDCRPPFKPRPFRFEWMWTTHPDCDSLIHESWSTTTRLGSHAFCLKSKTDRMKEKFKIWNKTTFGQVEREIEQQTNQLKQIQEKIQSVEDVLIEKILRDNLENLLHREQVIWAQKAKKDWDLKGDRNTRFFQIVIRNRRKRNQIVQLKNDDNSWVLEPKQIEDCITHFFHNLYSRPQSLDPDILPQLSNVHIPTITTFQAAQLEQPVLEVEIFQAFHQMGPLKTSGPDGIPAAFYQKYWNTVHTDITNMVKAFFHSGFILKSLNHTFITLSPKIPTPKKISQFRPISLYNVTYKIISKILIN